MKYARFYFIFFIVFCFILLCREVSANSFYDKFAYRSDQFVRGIRISLESEGAYNNSELKKAFLSVVFGNDPTLDSVNPYSEILKKLSAQEKTSVVVFMPEDLFQRNLIYAKIVEIFESISKVTGINFFYDNHESRQMMLLVIGNVEYVESSVSNFADIMGVGGQIENFLPSTKEISDRPLCFSLGLPHTQRKNAIGISISGIESKFFEKCIYTQIFRMLGLNNNLQSKNPTSLDELVDNAYPHHLDWKLLQLLYDSRFKPGMGRREVEVILDQVLSD